MAKWIGFSEAREIYLDRQDRSGHRAYVLEDAKYFSRVTLEALIDGSKPQDGSQPLVAKSGNADSFRLEFKSENENVTYTLLEGDQIPAVFWMLWREAIERSEKTPILLQNINHAPTSFDDNFKFVLTNMRDGGTVVGNAEQVQLLRDAIPLLPRGRGNPTGNLIDDEPLLDEMEQIIGSSGCGIRTAAEKVVGRASGASREAKIDRLRRKFARQRRRT